MSYGLTLLTTTYNLAITVDGVTVATDFTAPVTAIALAAQSNAATSATTATAAASSAVTSSASASASAVTAQTARDAAIAGAAGYYATTAAGLTGTALNAYFAVPVSGANDAVILYRHDAGPVATEITRLPSSVGLASGLAGVLAGASASAMDDPDYFFVFSDDNDRIALGSRIADGALIASASEIAGINTSASDDPDYMWTVADAFDAVGMGQRFDGGSVLAAGGATIYPSDDPDWMAVMVDPSDRIVAGLRIDGTVYTKGGTGSGTVAGKYSTINGLWIMGQSLGGGWEGLPLVTTATTAWGNLMFSRGVRTWLLGDHVADPQNRGPLTMQFAPMLEIGTSTGLGETIAHGMADHIKTHATGRYGVNPASAPVFMPAYSGWSSRQIQELTSANEETNVLEPVAYQQGGGYYATSIDNARQAVALAAASGQTFGVSAFIWMQGESQGGPTGGLYQHRWDSEAGTNELARPAGQQWYRDALIAHRTQWDADVRALTGQTRPIPMLTYQTLGPAGEAQLMAAVQDPNIYMVGNHSWMPCAENSRYGSDAPGNVVHMAADGYRWFGEQVGKVLGRVLDGEEWTPLAPTKATLAADRLSILVEYDVPRAPLVIDTDFVPEQRAGTGPYTSLRGYEVLSYAAGAAANIVSVTAERGDAVRIVLSSALPTGGYYVRYGNHADAGTVGVIASTRSGSATPTGQATTEIVFTGDLFTGKNLAAIIQEGCFKVASGANIATARTAYLSSGNTVIQIETRFITGTFAAGQTVTIARMYKYGNVRDSDREGALYTFTDTTYGTRQGKAYPLWNVAVATPETLIKE